MVYLALNSTLDFFFEAFKRDSQIAGLLVKTTKLLPMMFDLIQTTVVCFRQETLSLKNKSLLIIFFDKVIKMLHISILHPQEYTIGLLTKFLFDHEKTDDQADFKRRNWIYLVEMFKIINETSQSSYFYGHIDVKLALCRFISEFLLRLPVQSETHLDELVKHFPSQKLHEVMEETDLESYGSILLLEFGSVFKQLYIDRH